MQIEKIEFGNYYHIYNRGNNKQDIFIEEINYNYFLKLILKYLLPICEIYAFCLLKNHFHLLIRIKDECKNPSKNFSNLFNAYTKAINKKYGRSGSLLEKPFKRIKIDNENYLKTLVLYIHLNPEHHEIYDDFTKYKYSSFQSILSIKPSNIRRDEVLNLFEGKENFLITHLERRSLINSKIEYLTLE